MFEICILKTFLNCMFELFVLLISFSFCFFGGTASFYFLYDNLNGTMLTALRTILITNSSFSFTVSFAYFRNTNLNTRGDSYQDATQRSKQYTYIRFT